MRHINMFVWSMQATTVATTRTRFHGVLKRSAFHAQVTHVLLWKMRHSTRTPGRALPNGVLKVLFATQKTLMLLG